MFTLTKTDVIKHQFIFFRSFVKTAKVFEQRRADLPERCLVDVGVEVVVDEVQRPFLLEEKEPHYNQTHCLKLARYLSENS